jgi:hypothetical protein
MEGAITPVRLVAPSVHALDLLRVVGDEAAVRQDPVLAGLLGP